LGGRSYNEAKSSYYDMNHSKEVLSYQNRKDEEDDEECIDQDTDERIQFVDHKKKIKELVDDESNIDDEADEIKITSSGRLL